MRIDPRDYPIVTTDVRPGDTILWSETTVAFRATTAGAKTATCSETYRWLVADVERTYSAPRHPYLYVLRVLGTMGRGSAPLRHRVITRSHVELYGPDRAILRVYRRAWRDETARARVPCPFDAAPAPRSQRRETERETHLAEA